MTSLGSYNKYKYNCYRWGLVCFKCMFIAICCLFILQTLCVCPGTACCSDAWTAVPVSCQALPSSPSWGSWHRSRAWPSPMWLSQVMLGVKGHQPAHTEFLEWEGESSFMIVIDLMCCMLYEALSTAFGAPCQLAQNVNYSLRFSKKKTPANNVHIMWKSHLMHFIK